MFNLLYPLVRQKPWYPGQFGVHGSDVSRGMRYSSDAVVIYVDANAADASDAHDGTDPEAPKLTIQGAVDSALLVSGSVIVVSPAAYTESVTIAATRPNYCTLVGVAANQWYPTITSAAAASPCLDVRAEGWTIANLQFNCPIHNAGIQLWCAGDGSDDGAYKTIIENCVFDGLWGGLYGISFTGAPHRVIIRGCQFLELNHAGNTAYAIIVTDSSNANPYECQIIGNLFWENDNHIGSLNSDRFFNMSLFMGNILHEGVLNAATVMFDERGGSRGENIITQNVFCGDYSNPGGYWAHAGAPGNWNGNWAEDVAEAEVGTNSFTIAPPAA